MECVAATLVGRASLSPSAAHPLAPEPRGRRLPIAALLTSGATVVAAIIAGLFALGPCGAPDPRVTALELRLDQLYAERRISQDANDGSDYRLWIEVRDSTDPDELEMFVNKYPNSEFKELAGIRLLKLQPTIVLEKLGTSSPDEIQQLELPELLDLLCPVYPFC